MRRFVAWSVAVLVAIAGPMAGAAGASAAGPSTVPGLPVQLALGDSVAAGVGAGATEEERRRLGYVGLLHEHLRAGLDCVPAASPRPAVGCRQLQLVDLSVGGATTTTLIDRQLPAARSLLKARNADASPRNDVEAVTVTIGGNDLFGPVVAACIQTVPSDPALCASTISQVISSAGKNLDRILRTLAKAAGPEAEVVVMTYYNPLPACVLAPFSGLADVVLEGGSVPGLPPLAVGFNDVIRGVAAKNDVLVADTYGALSTDDLVGGSDCLHPDASGHAIIADVFAETLGVPPGSGG
jgi:lysophospholipase L1-like esterase